MKQKIIFELRRVLDKRIIALPITVVAVSAGLFTWFGCDRLSVYWAAPHFPSAAPSFGAMFILYLSSVALFSFLTVACAAFFGLGRCTLRVTLSYVLYLFWLPLSFPGRAGEAGVCAIIISLSFLILSCVKASRSCSIVPILGSVIGLWLSYCAIFTMAYNLI